MSDDMKRWAGDIEIELTSYQGSRQYVILMTDHDRGSEIAFTPKEAQKAAKILLELAAAGLLEQEEEA